MSGFFGYISTNLKLKVNIQLSDFIEIDVNMLQSEIEIKNSVFTGKIFRNSVNKFCNDKVFEEVDKNIFVLDGVILNKKELLEKYGLKNSIKDLMRKLYNKVSFYSEFRGTFAGCILYNNENKFHLFTNHIGDKEIFFHHDQVTNTLFFSTDVNVLVKLINKISGKKFKLNKNAAYSLLTHSHVLCNETLFEEIQRLTPGHYIEFLNKSFKKCSYFEINNDPVTIKRDEALQKLDELFCNAIKRAFEKDLEYGYKHLVALSGGLDSRMTTWVSHKMGYSNMTNYTFSQMGYLDEKIPREIVNKLKNEWIFKPLDNGVFIYKYSDKALYLSGGRTQNCTLAHTLSVLENVNFNEYGIVHTGQLGDVVIGTFYDKGIKQKFSVGSGAYSKRLISHVNYTKENAFNIEDQELFKMYNRGFTGVNIGLKPMFEYSETISPFLDIDFLEFCLKLPLEFRRGHSIYIEWINKYYPEAADFIYEKVNGKINKKIITINGIPIPWTSILPAAIKLLKNKLGFKYSSKNHMQPLDYWYKSNQKLSEYFQRIYSDVNIINDNELRENCKFLYENGNTLEKDQIVTLIGYLKHMENYMNK